MCLGVYSKGCLECLGVRSRGVKGVWGYVVGVFLVSGGMK